MNDERTGDEPTGDDRLVIDRVRRALDEVSAGEPLRHSTTRPRSTDTWRLVGVAAITVVLIGGAVTALARRSGTTDEAGGSPPTAASTAAATAATAAESTAPTGTLPVASTPASTVAPADASWFTLIAADLVPGRVQEIECCIERPCCPPTVVAWRIAAADDRLGLLLLSATSPMGSNPSTSVVPADDADRSVRPQVDGSVWTFTSVGLTLDERAELAATVVAGSGLPFVLQDERATLIVFGTEGSTESLGGGRLIGDDRGWVQTFTGALGEVELSVGSYWGELARAEGGGLVEDVTVAGIAGIRASNDERTIVLWPAAKGQWAVLDVPAVDAERIDGIIAGVVTAPAPG